MVTVKRRSGAEPFAGEKLEGFLFAQTRGLRLVNSDISELVRDISEALPAAVSVDQLLQLVSESTAQRVVRQPDFASLAGRVEAFRIGKIVDRPFSANFARLYNYTHPKTGLKFPLVSHKAMEFVETNKDRLDQLVQPQRDYELAYFGIKTLEKQYLLHMDGEVAETPQYLFLRVAVGIHCGNGLEYVAETYRLMLQRYLVHLLPTLFNAGTPYDFLLLCFLMGTEEDLIDGIYKTLHKLAMILKGSGGIGLHVHNVRANGALIRLLNGVSSGLVPMLRVFNNTARYVDQGGNKRPGAMAIYLEPWHADVFDVLELRKNHGKEELRARDLFYALWVPDLFMERVKADGDWLLFLPDTASGLLDCHSSEFVELYEKYEAQGLAVQTIKAQKLWAHILQCQIETGMPFMLYKDAANRKSNQQNLGTIKLLNLCCEIVEYSSEDEIAVCNLALLALPLFVKETKDAKTYDFDLLHSVTKTLVHSLDTVIDVTMYPVAEAEKSNKKHRPIAIGVQGLADVFMQLRLPFDSEEAKKLNAQIFETIYHGAVERLVELAQEKGCYESFPGSPASEGNLQFDLWGKKPRFCSWDSLKQQVRQHGLRNSLLVAPMPTASTSQILGFNECFEPFTSNIYTRRTLSGEYQVVNRYLVQDLIDMGLWNDSVKNAIVRDNGLVQNIPTLPSEIKNLYKTVWELLQRVIIDMAADRGCFVDQSQSMNIHLQKPTFGKLTLCHFYAWERGLKTGMYYLRTQAAARAIQFTVDPLAAADSAQPKLLARKPYIEQPAFKKRSLLTPESDSEGHKPAKVPRLSHNIYDDTPLACNIRTPENCDSCSG